MDTRRAPQPPPPPPPAAVRPRNPGLEEVARGQRMLIWAIAFYIVAGIALRATGGTWAIALPVAVVAGGIAVAGLLRVAGGLGYSPVKQGALFVLAFVPLAGLVTVALVNERATKALRAGGYRVGFMGAGRAPNASPM